MIVIALGANLRSRIGAPRETLKAALEELARQGVHVAAVSSYYETEAWPNPTDPPFVNAVARIETSRSPRELMELMHQVETYFDRQRNKRNAPRTLDLDLLDYEGRVQSGPPRLPHPRLAERAFVLVPLADVAPNWRHPVSGQTVGELTAALPPGARNIQRLVS